MENSFKQGIETIFGILFFFCGDGVAEEFFCGFFYVSSCLGGAFAEEFEIFTEVGSGAVRDEV
jgi:hypothetical protein